MQGKYKVLIGKKIRVKKTGNVATVTHVTEFDEDTFGQGAYAVDTDNNQYLYECEIEII